MMKTLFKILLLISAFSAYNQVIAQSPGILKNSVWTHQTLPTVVSAPAQSLTLDITAHKPAINFPNKVKEAFVQVIFDRKEDKFVDKGYNYTLKFNLYTEKTIIINSVPTTETAIICSDCKLDIKNTVPAQEGIQSVVEDKLLLNVASNLFDANANTYKDITKIKLEVISLTNNSPATTAIVQVKIAIAVGYGIDVTNLPVNNASQNINKKTILFNWSASPYIPNYEIELLRLYNVDKATATNEKIITTKIDWSKALKVETQSNISSFRLTIAEGQGFYIWRVRPIGNYFPNGNGNSQNYGNWSYGDPSALQTLNATTTLASPFFFFADEVDNDKNFIYSRTFTEGNRNKEVISYANGLQQSKQTQSYLPSVKNKVTVQTIYDHLGRPVITTLPVPTDAATEQGLTGYKEKFALNGNNALYNPADFDTDTKLNAPDPFKITATDFDYYSGKDNVASAEGYPFTRTLYYNDGTGRVKEQSGVGKKHMIREDPITKVKIGKTVKTLYSTSSEQELVRLFGKEAPDARSVLKTITTDQNGIASITYTSKEGKVIATCLSLTEVGPLDPLTGEPAVAPTPGQTPTVTDKIVNGEKNFNTTTANRRIAFAKPTLIQGISYQLNCESLTSDLGCFSATANCTFEIQVIIRKIDDVWASSFSVPVLPTLPATAAAISWYKVDENTIKAYQSVTCTSGIINFDNITLPEGSYIIEKQLVFKQQSTAISDQSEKDILPLAGLIKKWLSEVKCNQDFATFFNKVSQLQTQLDNGRAFIQPPPPNSTPSQAATLLAMQQADQQTHYIQMGRDNGIPNLSASGVIPIVPFFSIYHTVERSGFDAIVISGKCCKGIRVSLESVAPFDLKVIKLVDVGGDGKYKVNPFFGELPEKTEFFPDFEGYAYAYFRDCIPQNLLDNVVGAYPADIYEPVMTDLPRLRLLFSGTDAQYAALDKPTELIRIKNTIRYIHYKVLVNKEVNKTNYMRGWDTPGTLNSMVYHMLTDVYTTDGLISANNLTDPNNVIKTKPEALKNECGETLYPVFSTTSPYIYYTNQADFNANLTKDALHREKTVHYYGEDLFKCWSNQLGYLKSLTKDLDCPDGVFVDLESEQDKFSETIDNNNGSGNTHDSQYNDHIDGNWFTSWLASRKIKKLSKRIRNMQVPPVGGVRPVPDADGGEMDESDYQNESIKASYHLVSEFLNCTGYRFAKVMTNFDRLPLQEDNATSVATPAYTYPAIQKIATPAPAYVDFTQPTYSGTPLVKYKPLYDGTTEWQVWVKGNKKRILRAIKNPIYAFKYFEYYEDNFPQVETITCFSDPNWRKHEITAATLTTPAVVKGIFLKTTDNNNTTTANVATPAPTTNVFYDIHPDTGQLISPPANNPNDLCEICGIGYVKCEATYKMWSQGQRYTFFMMINEAVVPRDVDWTDAELSAKDFAAVGYTQRAPVTVATPNPIRKFYLWETGDELSASAYGALASNGFKKLDGERYKTKVELEITKLNLQAVYFCEQERPHIKIMLLEELRAKCYVVGDAYCRVPGTALTDKQKWDNARHITMADVDFIVEALVRECKQRGLITTYRRSSTGCRDQYVPIILPSGVWNLGYRDKAGDRVENISRVEYGVGKGDENQVTYASEIYKRVGTTTQIGATSTIDKVPSLTMETILPTIIANTTPTIPAVKTKILDLTPLDITSPGVNPDREEFNAALHNYCEWNRRREVTEMLVKAKMKSMCEKEVIPATLACDTGDCEPIPATPGMAGQTSNPAQPANGLPNPDVNGGIPNRKSKGVKGTARISVTTTGEVKEFVKP